MNRSFSDLAAGARTAFMAVGTAAAAGATAIKLQFDSISERARQLSNSAQVAGVGMTDFQRQAFAASSVGIEFEKLGDIFKDVRDRIGDFVTTGGGPMKDFFEQIAPKVGVTAAQFAKLGGKEGLQLYYDSLVKAGVSSEQMVFYLEAMASDVTNLIPLLKENGKAFDELGAKASIISDADIAKLQEYTRAQQELQAAGQEIVLAAVDSGILDGFVTLTQYMAELVRQMAGVTPAATEMGESVSKALNLITQAATVAGTVIASRYAIALGTTAVAAANSFLIANRAAIAGMVAYATVSPVLGTATIALTGLRAAAMGVLAMFGGPWGVAIAAAAAGAYFLYQRIQQNTNGQRELADAAARVAPIKDKVREASERLASSMGKTRAEALASAKAIRQETVQLIKNTQEKLRNAQARLVQLKTDRTENMFSNSRSTRGAGGGIDPVLTGRGRDDRIVQGEENRIAGIKKEISDLEAARAKIDADIKAASTPLVSSVTPVSAGSVGGGGGPSKAEAERDQARQLLTDLAFQGEQLKRNALSQEIFNNLRAAGLTTEAQMNSEMGKAIEAQTRANDVARQRADLDEMAADALKDYAQKREELGKTDEELALLAVDRMFENDLFEEGNILVDGRIAKLKEQIRLYFAEKKAIEESAAAYAKFAELLTKSSQEYQQQQEEQRRARMQIGRDLADIGIRAFDGLIKGSMSFGDAFRGIISDLGQMMLETLVYAPLRELAAQLASQATKGLLGSLFKTAAGAAAGATTTAPAINVAPVGKALGGSVEGGRPYYVGERGAEMFVPDRSGMIVPNRKMGGNSTTVSPTYNIMLNGNPEANQQTLAQIKRAQAEQNAYIRQQNQKKGWN
ncbi:hypothetical protein [Erythrobacter sp. R86502]|uniref:hypothetical protein n=1 Tax=Erythrobacter sp. R86502 TaxID=3093846 RepID=UPI0036D3B1F1